MKFAWVHFKMIKFIGSTRLIEFIKLIEMNRLIGLIGINKLIGLHSLEVGRLDCRIRILTDYTDIFDTKL